MRDLNANMFYKAKFQISVDDSENFDLLWKVVLNLRAWITKKLNHPGDPVVEERLGRWSAFKNGGKLYDCQSRNRFYAESAYREVSAPVKQVFWACMMVEKPTPEPGFAQREWTTEIGYRSLTPGTAELSYVVTYRDATGFLGPCADVPGITVPNIIRRLLSDPALHCTIGPHTITCEPQKLAPGDYPKFKKLLFDPNREVPVIYISPQRDKLDDSHIRLMLSPERVAASTAANALVFYAENPDFSQEMRLMEKDSYTCSDGAVRVYAPHIDTANESDPYRHRFFLAREIEERGEDATLQIFRRALAQDVHFYDSMFRLPDCRALLDEDRHQARLAQLKLQSEGDVDEAVQEFLNEAEKRKEAEDLAQELMDQLEDQKRDNHSLSIQLEAFREKAARCTQAEEATRQLRTTDQFPNTPVRLAKYFELLFPDRIAFTPRAYRSLEDCPTKCDVLWDIFYHMATDLYTLLREQPAQAHKEFTNKTGWDCARGEGKMTRKDAGLMKQYTDRYNGKEIDIQAHIKSGVKESDPRFVRVYFAYDPTVSDKVIVGHCGRHLDNYTTQKIK